MTIPWVEKYRPTNSNEILLDTINRKLIEGIVYDGFSTNVLLYGPPGCGKTTTALNMIRMYQMKNTNHDSKYVMHLNASDDRGVDMIRNQLKQFATSQTMFTDITKIIILDEVDYMTKSAQYALKNLIECTSIRVRFILICNYITRIEPTLRNMFIRICFLSFSSSKIVKHLAYICKEEKINIKHNQLKSIVEYFHTDIRSMINYLQLNRMQIGSKKILHTSDYKVVTNLLLSKNPLYVLNFVKKLTLMSEISVYTFWMDYFLHQIPECEVYISNINSIEYIMKMENTHSELWHHALCKVLCDIHKKNILL